MKTLLVCLLGLGLSTSSMGVEIPLGPLGAGITAREDAEGPGFILFCPSGLSSRFLLFGPQATHFTAVFHLNRVWYYYHNELPISFTSTPADVLVAQVDFTADTATLLQGQDTVIHGIRAGYAGGDLGIVVNQWGGVYNEGEFTAPGTHIDLNEPNWWTERGVITANPANNLAVATLGQAKHIAGQAHAELESLLPGGAGFALDSLFPPPPENPDETWYRDQKMALNLGQLKALAAPFYNRLNAIDAAWVEWQLQSAGLAILGEHYFQATNGYFYAWNPATPVAENYRLAAIGQLKSVFHLRFRQSLDNDSLPDIWELAFIDLHPESGITTIDDLTDTSDPDEDSLTAIEEYEKSTDPFLPDTDGDGLDDGWEAANGLAANLATGDDGANGDPDEDGIPNWLEMELSRSPVMAYPVVLVGEADGTFEYKSCTAIGRKPCRAHPGFKPTWPPLYYRGYTYKYENPEVVNENAEGLLEEQITSSYDIFGCSHIETYSKIVSECAGENEKRISLGFVLNGAGNKYNYRYNCDPGSLEELSQGMATREDVPDYPRLPGPEDVLVVDEVDERIYESETGTDGVNIQVTQKLTDLFTTPDLFVATERELDDLLPPPESLAWHAGINGLCCNDGWNTESVSAAAKATRFLNADETEARLTRIRYGLRLPDSLADTVYLARAYHLFEGVDGAVRSEGAALIGAVGDGDNVILTSTKAAIEPPSDFGTVRPVAPRVDLKVDSDNDGSIETASEEDKVENDPARRGKVLFANLGDFDLDHIPGYRDGFDLDSQNPKDDAAAERFAPLRVTLIPGMAAAEDCLLVFRYADSPPADAGTPDAVRDKLRIWTVNGDEPRDLRSAAEHSSGCFVPTGIAVPATRLGLSAQNLETTLYIEAMPKSGDDLLRHAIHCTVIPSGAAPPDENDLPDDTIAVSTRPPVRILAIGDSLTYGCINYRKYRNYPYYPKDPEIDQQGVTWAPPNGGLTENQAYRGYLSEKLNAWNNQEGLAVTFEWLGTYRTDNDIRFRLSETLSSCRFLLYRQKLVAELFSRLLV